MIPLLERLVSNDLHQKVSIYFAPIHSWGNDAHELAAETQSFSDWEIEWFVKMRELGFQQKHYLPGRKKNLCIATSREDELIDPFGEVFSCTEVSLVQSYEADGKNIHALGDVFSDALKYEERREIFEVLP